MVRNALFRLAVLMALCTSSGLATVKFGSAAKYRLLSSESTDKVVFEVKMYGGVNPGCVYSEVLKALPESYIPFEYKGIVLAYSPTDALYEGTELLLPDFVDKSLELLGKENKQLDIDAYIDVVERTLKTRVYKLNLLTCACIAGTAATWWIKLPKSFAELFLPQNLTSALYPAAPAPQVQGQQPQRAPIISTWIRGAASSTFASGAALFLHNKNHARANAAQITKALLNYPHRKLNNVEKVRESVINIANLAGNAELELLAETIA